MKFLHRLKERIKQMRRDRYNNRKYLRILKSTGNKHLKNIYYGNKSK